jgi:hypothetical protein
MIMDDRRYSLRYNHNNDQCILGFSLGLGAQVMMSSTRMIISAASLAEIRACSLDLRHS